MLFTSLHLYANYRGVRAVQMSSLNRERFRLLLHRWLEDLSKAAPVSLLQRAHAHTPMPSSSDVPVPRVPLASVEWANAREPVLLPTRGAPWHPRLRIGDSLAEYLSAASARNSRKSHRSHSYAAFRFRFRLTSAFSDSFSSVLLISLRAFMQSASGRFG